MPPSPLPSQLPDEPTSPLSITVTFTGGLELLFNNIQTHHLSIPSTTPTGDPVTMKFLIPWLVENVMVDERREMFSGEEGGV